MKIKLIAIDMDGTLLDSNKELSQETIDTVREAIKADIKIVLCTGRPTKGALDATKELGLYGTDAYLITYHGAVTTKLDTFDKVTTHTISPSEIKDLFRLADEFNSQSFAITDYSMDTTTKNTSDLASFESKIMQIPIKHYSLDELDPNQHYDKFMLMDNPEIIDKAEKGLPKELNNHYTILRSDPHFLEFINKKSDKGTAVEELASKLNIPLDQVMGIGDGGNDFHLIETVGFGVAMGNALDEIKNIADYVADTNDNNGAAKAIRKFALSEDN